MKWKFTVVPVTVAVAASSGASAANPALVGPAMVIGVVPAGAATTTGAIESVSLNTSTGVVTVVTQAAVADADMVVNVIVGVAIGS